MKRYKRFAVMGLVLALVVTLAACGTNGGANSAEDGGASQSSGTTAEASGELYGKPWVTSILQGNLPTQQPAVTDDLYTHYTYDYLAAHQEQPSSLIEESAADLQTACLAVIDDDTKSNHDLDQLRIFYGQALDTETLKKAGLADVQPYLDRIDAVTSIDEMNKLLLSDDFPFSPFVTANLAQADKRDVYIVVVNPNLAFCDPLLVGGAYYQDSDDPQVQENLDKALMGTASESLLDLLALGMDTDEVGETLQLIKDFEKPHAKYLDYNGKYSTQEYGAEAQAIREGYVTLDELCAACPNFPMQAMLDKLGKGASPLYSVSAGWAEAFNEQWANGNIDVIKQIAKLKVLNETRPYRDQTPINQLLEQEGQPVSDAETSAYKVCDSLDTLAIVLSNIYVDEGLGASAKQRLTKLSQDLVDAYKDLVTSTTWMGDESRQNLLAKLDHMTLNVLEPSGGYYDFSGLELTPTDEGGTLLGNYLKLKQYRQDQESKLVGQQTCADALWHTFSPAMSNAFYDPTSNSINILPGYVTSLIYADDMSDQDLLARIGFVIGHEMSHGFDYSGGQYDAYGVPNPVYSDDDVEAFSRKSAQVASYYSGLEVASDVMVNGTNVVTEATSDLCGMQVILEVASKSADVDYEEFFAAFAEQWSQVVAEGSMPSMLLDTHPLNNLRVNVNAQMFDPIYEELGVKEGDGMYLAPEERVNVWGTNA